jgi:hypothetical protein
METGALVPVCFECSAACQAFWVVSGVKRLILLGFDGCDSLSEPVGLVKGEHFKHIRVALRSDTVCLRVGVPFAFPLEAAFVVAGIFPTEELFCLKPKRSSVTNEAETCRLRKRLQMMAALPE